MLVKIVNFVRLSTAKDPICLMAVIMNDLYPHDLPENHVSGGSHIMGIIWHIYCLKHHVRYVNNCEDNETLIVIKFFCCIHKIWRTAFLWAFVSIMVNFFIWMAAPLPCQAGAVAGEKNIEILVGFKAKAVIEPLPAGIISWHKIGGSWIVRMKVRAAQADDVVKLLKQRQDVRFVERSRHGSFQQDTGNTGNRFGSHEEPVGSHCRFSSESDMTGSDNSEDLHKSQWFRKINGNKLAGLSWGAGTLVAVVDTGIDSQNPEMNSRGFTNSREIPDDMQDNDGNGYIDDLRGWDFGDKDNNPLDENGHGTEVASIITAVSPHCRILPVKINKGGGDSFETADLVEGIYYAITLGAKVINLSLTVDQQMESVSEAIEAAHDAGIAVVAAAGNDPDNMIGFPASMDSVIAVGSLYEDQPASFSPQGPKLDIMAPGVAVACITLGGYQSHVSGTSFSCAMVTGACAVLRGMNSHLKVDTVTQLLFSGTEDMGIPGRDDMFGQGALDGSLLFHAASPDLKLPFRPFYAFPRSTPIPVDFHLPPSDTASLVFVGILSPDNSLAWLDAYGTWHSADQTAVSFLAEIAPLSECADGTLFGEGGAFPLFDPSFTGSGSATGFATDSGLYRFVIAVTDESGTLIGPVIYDYMLLF